MQKTESERKSAATILALAAVGKIGPVKIKSILARAQRPDEILDWDNKQFCDIPGISERLAGHIKEKLDIDYGNQLIDWADENRIHITTIADTDYPSSLRAIYDAPPFLFIKGEVIEADKKAVAIVGSRNASDYGRITATRIAEELSAREITIISGMATGIDSASHRGALQGGGRTIAVLGSGVDIIYPYDNRKLYNEIAEKGAVISEFFPGTEPYPGNFPRRNRIIAGLSQAVVVVEAGKKSGALLTADYALEQGKKLFAVPGNLSSRTSVGANELIKSGAVLMTSTEDIYSALPEFKNIGYISPDDKIENLSNGENKIFKYLSDQPVQFDTLIRKCDFSVGDASTYLLSLELRGLIKQLSGKRFVAT